MLGNVYEWCHEQYYRYPEGEGNTTTHDMNILSSIKEQNPRLLRGGAFGDEPAFVHSANRDWDPPSNRVIYNGFRLARTYP
jgi:iron(II)-dependent oxidoreductase